METYLDKMDKALLSPDTNLTIITKNFLEDYAKYARIPNTIFCFFEGLEDPSFYRDPIDIVFNYPNVYIYFCMGIDYLFQYYEEIENRKDVMNNYNRYQLLFFADKDLDDFLGLQRIAKENIYRHKNCYSTENYVFTPYVLERVLVEVFFLNNKADIDNILYIYNEAYRKFINMMIPIMSAIILFKKKNLLNFELDDLKVDTFFKLTNQTPFFQKEKKNKRFISRFQIFKQNLLTINKSHFRELIEIMRQLKGKSENPESFLRGHYLGTFFKSFLDFLKCIIDDTFYYKKFSENQEKLKKLKRIKEYFNKKNGWKKLIKEIIAIEKDYKQEQKLNKNFTLNVAFRVDNEKILFAFLAPRAKFPTELIDFLKYNQEKLNNATAK